MHMIADTDVRFRGRGAHSGGAMSLVSVVIPTTGRPQTLLRAVHSALAQTHQNLEIVVVVDGPNPETIEATATVRDPRLRIVKNPVPLGGGEARNKGVAEASGEWVALLDDDDEWMPTKLERQLSVATVKDDVLVSCVCRVATPFGSFEWPVEVYDDRLTIDEYLFDRRTLLRGGGFLQTSTFLMPRRIFQMVKFRPIPQHQDWDFLLRASKTFGVRVKMLSEVLTVYHTDGDKQSISRDVKWRESLAWLDTMHGLVSPRAYSGFCCSVVAPRADKVRAYEAVPILIGRILRMGSPTPVQLLLFLSSWSALKGLRRVVKRVRAWLVTTQQIKESR
jgi:GT2 family glycosyltransferase